MSSASKIRVASVRAQSLPDRGRADGKTSSISGPTIVIEPTESGVIYHYSGRAYLPPRKSYWARLREILELGWNGDR